MSKIQKNKTCTNNNCNRLKMGYFSQRKKQARQNLFMLFSLGILAIIYLLLFFGENGKFIQSIRAWQFHIYLYNIFLVMYTLLHRRGFYTVLAVFLLILNYGSLAQSARLFFNKETMGINKISLNYHKGEQNYLPVDSQEDLVHHGKLELSPHLEAAYHTINRGEQTLTIITVDFQKEHNKEYATAYHNLEKFITLQNGPVIIVGDFGIPSWNLLFKEFLNNTDLSVKNRILFTDGKTSFRFWFVPSLNILGFDNLGIEKISMQNGKFDIRLNY